MNKGIAKAIEICGSQSELARASNSTQPSVRLWLEGGKMDVKYIPKIIKATNGEVTARDLRPDVDWDTIKASL